MMLQAKILFIKIFLTYSYRWDRMMRMPKKRQTIRCRIKPDTEIHVCIACYQALRRAGVIIVRPQKGSKPHK